MNRFRKALSMNRGHSNDTTTTEKSLAPPSPAIKKRFSLFGGNSSHPKKSQSEHVLDLSRLNLSTPSVVDYNNNNIVEPSDNSSSTRQVHSGMHRPRSAHFNNNSSFTTSTTTTTTTTTTSSSSIISHPPLANTTSLRSFQCTDMVPSIIVTPRHRSHKISKTASNGIEQQEGDDEINLSQQQQLDDADYLQLGMKYHEKGELEKATHYWRLSAEYGSPLGLFFYGIALRHGWGCKKNSAKAVRYLQKAAESAVHDLQTGIAQSASVAKSELVLAIYELGVCFRHGWGVPKNLETAAYYFEVASNLGDPDAQNDLGFCYAQGLGVKKDLYCSAKYYRLAEKQGQGIIGNSWIWKEKYNQVEEPGWNGKRAKK